MTISKGGTPIATLGDWLILAGPKSIKHWVDGRSAKESARAWLEGNPEMPAEVTNALTTHHDFGPVINWDAEPEAKFRFDDFRGEPRNSDLAVRVRDKHGQYLLAVEAKADEPFGETVGDTFADALERYVQISNSKGIDRIRSLARGLFAEAETDKTNLIASLRYQLLTAAAGSLAEGQRLGFQRTVLLVHEFITDRCDEEKQRRNADDLNRFARRISGGAVSEVEPGKVYGPIKVVGEGAYSKPPALYLGFVSRDLRTRRPIGEQLELT
jgi:hypothetical protein